MTREPTRSPTAEEASAKASVTFGENRWTALWYPQMGGYVALCWVHTLESGCFDCQIWHDGEFPFDEDSEPKRSPVMLHHCDPKQFVRFGRDVASLVDHAGN